MKRSSSSSSSSAEICSTTNKKIIILGDGCTGKSTYLNYIKSLGDLPNYKYTKLYNATDNFNLMRLKLDTNHGSIMLDIWDTAGQEQYNEIRDAYIIGAHACLVFYDISEKKTIDNVQKWLEQIKKLAPNIPVAVIGNKSDKFANIQQSINHFQDR